MKPFQFSRQAFVLCLAALLCCGCGLQKEAALGKNTEAAVPVAAPSPFLEKPRWTPDKRHTLPEKAVRRLTAKAERGDTNSAARLWGHYRYGCGDEEKAAYFLNIAGRGGTGVGQYGIAYYDVYSGGKKERATAGHMGDRFILSEELIQMLEPRAEQDDAEAAFRLYQHYNFAGLEREKSRYYLILSAKHGHPKGIRNLKALYSEEGAKMLLEQYARENEQTGTN